MCRKHAFNANENSEAKLKKKKKATHGQRPAGSSKWLACKLNWFAHSQFLFNYYDYCAAHLPYTQAIDAFYANCEWDGKAAKKWINYARQRRRWPTGRILHIWNSFLPPFFRVAEKFVSRRAAFMCRSKKKTTYARMLGFLYCFFFRYQNRARHGAFMQLFFRLC